MKTKLLFSVLLAGSLTAQTYTNTTLVPIPDNTPAGTTSVIPVSLVKTINDPSKVTINMDLTHTWSGDITVALRVPGGSTTGAIALIKRLGSTAGSTAGSNANFGAGNVLGFNSAATATINTVGIASTSNIPSGVYLPSAGTNATPTDYTVANLSTLLNGVAVSGNWTLFVSDSVADDLGSLNNWQIVFDAGTFLGVNTSIVNTPALSVMGNPFKETLNLKINTAAKDVKFDIYSMDGKKVYSNTQSAIAADGALKISTDSWAPGLYILSPVLNGEKLMNIKLIKK